jgi:hypothetical protein
MKLPNVRNRASQRQQQQHARQQRTQQLLLERFRNIPVELMHVEKDAKAAVHNLVGTE